MSGIKNIDKVLGKIEDYLSMLAFFLMIIDVIIIVFTRYVFKVPFTPGEEIARYLMIWCAYSGAAYGFRHHSHVGVVVFSEMFPKKWHPTILKIRKILTFLVVAALFIFSLMDFLNRVKSGQVSTALGMSMAVVVLIIPLSMLIGMFHSFMDILGEFSPTVKQALAEQEVAE